MMAEPSSRRLPPDGHEFPGDYSDDPSSRGRSGSNGGMSRGKIIRDVWSERSVKDKIALFTHEAPKIPITSASPKKYPTLSCSVDNLTTGRSPMVSPIIRTLLRNNNLANSTPVGSSNPSVNNSNKSVSCETDLNERSRSLLDVASGGGSAAGQQRPMSTSSGQSNLLQPRKTSLINLNEANNAASLIASRRKSLTTKLRGLVIPNSAPPASPSHNQSGSRAAIDLPEIISKDSVLALSQLAPAAALRSPTTSNGTSSDAPDGIHQMKKISTSLSSLPWKSSSPSLPKYSPAFKRKDLAVVRTVPTPDASPAPPQPPSTKPPPLPPPDQVEEDVAAASSRSEELNSDTDGDSAVSSSRSSFSPSGSPVPDRSDTLSANGSSRVLKANSVEALNRKNVLQSARVSSGGGNGGIPEPSAPIAVPKAEVAGSRIERSSPRLRLSSSERLEVKTAFITDVSSSPSAIPPPSVLRVKSKEVNSFRALAERWEAIASEAVPAPAVSAPVVPVSSPPPPATPPVPLGDSKPTSSSSLSAMVDPIENISPASASSASSSRSRAVGVLDIRQAFERVKEELMESADAEDYIQMYGNSKPHGIFNVSGHHHFQHVRMSSLDSMTSEDGSIPFGMFGVGMGQAFGGVRDNYGSITSLASSTSLISPQELQQLLDEANQSLEESGTPSHEIVVVVLHRSDLSNTSGSGGSMTLSPGLGITLAGGADYETKEITIHKVIGGSVADRDGRVQKGDRVLSINGKGLKGVTHREALAILKAPRPEVVLVLSRNRSVSPQDEDLANGIPSGASSSSGSNAQVLSSHLFVSRQQQSVLLSSSSSSSGSRPPRILESPLDFGNFDSEDVGPARGPAMTTTLVKAGAGLGFSLEGGKDSPLGDRPLTVKKIFSGGAASKSETLRVGDQILSVNGCDVTSMSRIEAWNLMKKLPDGNVTLVIRQQIASSPTTP